MKNLFGGKAKRRDLEEDALRQTLAGLDLGFERFRGRLYVFGVWQDCRVSFKSIAYAGDDLTAPAPALAGQALNCRLKIPGTAGQCFQMSVRPRSRPGQAGIFHRVDPEQGFTLGPFAGQTPVESRAVFARIPRALRDRLMALAERFNTAVAITTDWEIGEIGRKNALSLLENDEEALACLSLQAVCPLAPAAEDLLAFLGKMREAALALGEVLK